MRSRLSEHLVVAVALECAMVSLWDMAALV